MLLFNVMDAPALLLSTFCLVISLWCSLFCSSCDVRINFKVIFFLLYEIFATNVLNQLVDSVSNDMIGCYRSNGFGICKTFQLTDE